MCNRIAKQACQFMGQIPQRQLLAKLNEGDMPTTEAKYHKECLTDTFNKFKVEERKNQCKEQQDVIQYIKDTIFNT